MRNAVTLFRTKAGISGLMLLGAWPLAAQHSIPTAPAPTTTLNANTPVVDIVQAMTSSLTLALGLSDKQIQKLDCLYARYASRRLEQESKSIGWQAEYQRITGSPTGDRRRASELWKGISDAQQKVIGAFGDARKEALSVLTDAQRAALPALAPASVTPQNLPPGVRRVSEDSYYQLLLLPVDRVLGTLLDDQIMRRLAASTAYNYRHRQRSYGFGSYGFGGFSFPGHWDLGYHGWSFSDHYGSHGGVLGGHHGGHRGGGHH